MAGVSGGSRSPNPIGVACCRKARCNGLAMKTKSREVIWGRRIIGAEIRAQGAREAAEKAARAPDRTMGGPPRSAPAKCLRGA